MADSSQPVTKTVGEHIQGKDIEMRTFDQIETSKHQLLVNFLSFPIADIKAQMKDLCALMETILLGGYFTEEEVRNFKYPQDAKVAGYSYNFFEYVEMIDITDDKNYLREILKNEYVIYNRFKVKRLKISVSTEASNPIERSPEPLLLHNRKSAEAIRDALEVQDEEREAGPRDELD